jgi:uncharacterized protein
VDFVVEAGGELAAIEVKSSRQRETLAGLEAFGAEFKPRRTFLVGADGIPVEEFLSRSVSHWIES